MVGICKVTPWRLGYPLCRAGRSVLVCPVALLIHSHPDCRARHLGRAAHFDQAVHSDRVTLVDPESPVFDLCTEQWHSYPAGRVDLPPLVGPSLADLVCPAHRSVQPEQ